MVYEFARLEIDGAVMSKRKLKELVDNGTVKSWDDPRMPTLMGLRCRGFTPKIINTFLEEIGITRTESIINPLKLYNVASRILDITAPRSFCILDPVSVHITNIPNTFNYVINAPIFPKISENYDRSLVLSNTIFVERSCIGNSQSKKDFYGLVEGRYTRLRYGPVVLCKKINIINDIIDNIEVEIVVMSNDPQELKDVVVNTNIDDNVNIKTKSIIQWIPDNNHIAEVRIYDSLDNFSEKIFKNALVEKYVKDNNVIGNSFQFERCGYFTIDKDTNTTNIVLNNILPINFYN